MSKVLIDAAHDEWSAVIPHESRQKSYEGLTQKIDLVRLHPHRSDNGVTVTYEGRTIGHLPSDLVHFHQPIKRMTDAGIVVMAEAKIKMMRNREELVVPYANEQFLRSLAYKKVSQHRKHEAEKKRMSFAPRHKDDVNSLSVA